MANRAQPASNARSARRVSIAPYVRSPEVEDILLWRDTKKSGAALAVVTAVFSVVQFAKFNVISAWCYSTMALILGAFLWNAFANFTHRPSVPVPAVLKEGVTEAQAKAAAEKATVYVNKFLSYVDRLVTGHEPALLLVVLGALWALAWLATAVSVPATLYVLVLLAFTVPRLYENYQDEIDAAVDKLRKQATSIYDKYLHKYASKIPRAAPARPAESSSLAPTAAPSTLGATAGDKKDE